MRPEIRTYGLPASLRLRHVAAILAIATGAALAFDATAISEPHSEPDARQTRALAKILSPPQPGSFAVADSTRGAGQDCVQRLATFLDPVAIEFEFGSSFVDARHAPLLEQISERIATCPEARITIAGHADGSGSDAANAALSWDRADRALNLLVSLGVPPEAVQAAGMGATMPLSQGSDEEDAADRRVEFIVRSSTNR